MKEFLADGTIEQVEKDAYRIPKKESRHARFARVHKEKGLCTRCSEPATSTILCDFHREQKREQSKRKNRVSVEFAEKACSN